MNNPHEELRKILNQYHPHPTFQSKFIPKTHSVSTKGKIILGYRTRNGIKNIVSVPYDGKSISFLIGGGKRGDGKSVVAFNIADALALYKEKDHPGIGIVFIDPKGECWVHRFPNKKKQYFKERGLKPYGHSNMIKIIPSHADCMKATNINMDEIGKKEHLLMLNTNEMTCGDLSWMMSNAKDSSAAQSKLEAIAGEHKMKLYGDKSVANLIKSRDVTLPEIGELEQLIKKKSIGNQNDVLLRNFNALLSSTAIGRINEYSLRINPKTGKNIYAKPPDIIKLLNQGKLIDFIPGLRSKKNPVISAYIAILLRKISDARQEYLNNGGHIVEGSKIKALKKCMLIYIEEMNTVYPAQGNPISKEIITEAYDQWRFKDISLVGITPNFNSIDPIAIKQSDYVITSIPSAREMKILAKEKGIDERGIIKLMDLKVMDTHPKQLALINRHGEVIPFYPMLCRSQIMIEGMMQAG